MDAIGMAANNGIIDTVKDLGFGVGFMVLCFVVVFYILRQQKEILAQAKAERGVFLATIERFTKSLEDHTAQAREFHETVTRAHEYQREEHKEVKDSQNSICQTLALVAAKLQGSITG